MLRRFCAVLFVVMTAVAADAADKPSGVTGLYLTTRYPALTVRAGETTTIDLRALYQSAVVKDRGVEELKEISSAIKTLSQRR